MHEISTIMFVNIWFNLSNQPISSTTRASPHTNQLDNQPTQKWANGKIHSVLFESVSYVWISDAMKVSNLTNTCETTENRIKEKPEKVSHNPQKAPKHCIEIRIGRMNIVSNCIVRNRKLSNFNVKMIYKGCVFYLHNQTLYKKNHKQHDFIEWNNLRGNGWRWCPQNDFYQLFDNSIFATLSNRHTEHQHEKKTNTNGNDGKKTKSRITNALLDL